MQYDTFGRPVGLPLPPPRRTPPPPRSADLVRITAKLATTYAEDHGTAEPRLYLVDHEYDSAGGTFLGVNPFPDQDDIWRCGPPGEALEFIAEHTRGARPGTLLHETMAFALAYGAWKSSTTEEAAAARRAMGMQIRDDPMAVEQVNVMMALRDGRIAYHERGEGMRERAGITRVFPRYGAPSVTYSNAGGRVIRDGGNPYVGGAVTAGLIRLVAATGPYSGTLPPPPPTAPGP